MNILICTRETTIVALDMLPRLNYYENAFAAGLCIYLSAVKQHITLQKILPVEEALELLCAGSPEF